MNHPIDNLRVPPQNIQHEACVLASMILGPEYVGPVRDVLAAVDFYRPAHQIIFAAICTMTDRRDPVDLVTLRKELVAMLQLDAIGGIEYLAAMVEGVPSPRQAVFYSREVREASVKRQLIILAASLSEDAFSPATGADELLDEAQRSLFQLDYRIAGASIREASVGEAAKRAADAAAAVKRDPGAFGGVKLGFGDVDAFTFGLLPGEVMAIGGRTGSGKTAFALNALINVALAGGTGLYVSGEMLAEQLGKRALQYVSGVWGSKLRAGQYTEEDQRRIDSAIEILGKLRLWLSCRKMSIPQIAAKARHLAQKWGKLDLVAIDYLQIMDPHTGRTKLEQVSAMSEMIHDIALDLGVPILVLSQFSREGVKAFGGKAPPLPSMHHLKETGSIENDCDIVFLLHRPRGLDGESCRIDYRDKSVELWGKFDKGRDIGETPWREVDGAVNENGLRFRWYPAETRLSDYDIQVPEAGVRDEY